MPEAGGRGPQEGDELWIGPVGPIPVSDVVTPERQAWIEAGRIAQAAHSLNDLARLVASHPDYRVRYEAIPRLKARFRDERLTLDVLAAASREPEAAVRDAAVMALGDLHSKEAADHVADRLTDQDFEVRLTAAQTLAHLGDERAPADPEVWALEQILERDSGA
jgi:HEAT repeat protein